MMWEKTHWKTKHWRDVWMFISFEHPLVHEESFWIEWPT